MTYGYIGFYFFIGVLTLLSLTWQDYKNKMLVDSRRIYFMTGITSFFIFLNFQGLFHIFANIIISIFTSYGLTKSFKWGKADIDMYMTLSLGMFMMGLIFWLVFLLTLIIMSLLFFSYYKIQGSRLPKPYFIVLLLTWVITWGIMYLY